MSSRLRSALLYGLSVAVVVGIAAAVVAWQSPRLSVQDAMAVVQAVGVVLGARFAVLNLQEIRRAAEAETEPLLHVVLREIRMNETPGHAIEVHNLGRGGVVGASVRCWARMALSDTNHSELEEIQLELSTSTISPNGSAEASLFQSTAKWAMQSDLLVEVTYDSVRQRRASQIWHFVSVANRLSLTPLPSPRLRPPSA